jgi:hypothetical protein
LLVPKYRQDLPKYIRLCEQNYAHINKLLPIDNFKGAKNKVLVGCFEFTFTVLEVSPYTNLVSLKQTDNQIVGFTRPELNVRIYHDAKVAEVVCKNYPKRVKPAYAYPNPDMHQKDEKYQLNAFLKDWLEYCIDQGRSTFYWDTDQHVV